jgi:hypothetical protein
MTYEATAKRDSYNELRIETLIPLPGVTASEGRRYPGKPGETKLAITTSKSNGTLISRASVSFYGDTFTVHAFGLGTGRGDYSTKIVTRPGRATEKALRALHADALNAVPTIIAEATAHYAAQEKAAA